MKKLISILLFFFIFTSVIYVQEIIENPEKPSNKNALRVINLKEVFRINDRSGDFYFKMIENLGNLKVAPDGTFLISDVNQLLKFSPQGKLVKNLLKIGEGPGEMPSRRYPHDIYLTQNDIYLYDGNRRKIVHTDMQGTLIEEIKLEVEGAGPLYSFYGLSGDEFIFIHQENVRFNMKSAEFYDLEMSIILISRDGTKMNKILIFPTKMFGAPGYGMGWAPFEAVIDLNNQQIFVYHTCEYRIVQADLEEGRTIKSFNRRYPRVKHVTKEWEKERIKKYNAPKRIYENDIKRLFLNKGLLWIETSTKDAEKGHLIDVFDREGRYIDCFYLPIIGLLKAVRDDSIFVVEKDADENLQIVKYEIVK